MSRLWWRLIRLLARACVWAYYRRFRVEGADRIPRAGAVLFVANHPNALVDAGAVLRAVPRPISFVAKSTLWSVPVLGWLLRRLGAVPVYRPSDQTGETRRNLGMFSAFTDHFRRGGAVVIFPEGLSHLDPELKEVKSGPARLALGAEEGADFALGLKVVPLGLHYEPRQRFRGEVLVRVGEPFGIADLATMHRRHAIHAIQERIAASLKPLVLHLERVDLEPLVRGVADVYDAWQRDRAGATPPRPKAEVVQITGAALNHFLVADPSAVEEARRRLARYERLARRVGVSDVALAGYEHPVRTFLGFLYVAVAVAVGLPLFLAGCLVGYLPYRATEAAAVNAARKEGRVSLPILRIAFGAVFFGSFWGLLALFVWLWSHSLGFTAIFLLGVVGTAYYARFYATRIGRWRARLRGLSLLLAPGMVRVARARDALLQCVSLLAARYAAEAHEPLIPPRRRGWLRRMPWRAATILVLLGAIAWFAWGLGDRRIAEVPDHPSPWATLDLERARETLERDALSLTGVLDTLGALERTMVALKGDFDAGRRRSTDPDDDRDVRRALLSYLSCRGELFRLVWTYRRPDRPDDPALGDRAFLLGYAAAVELCRRGLQLVDTFDGQPRAIRKLNEPEPACGVPPRIYDRIRRNLANAGMVDDVTQAAGHYRRIVARGARPTAGVWGRIADEADRGAEVVRTLGDRLWGLKLDAAVARAGSAVGEARYTASTFFAGLIGGVRVREGSLADGLISRAQVERLRADCLRPGDILLERRNWALTNVFLPGFWTHAALYVGGVEGLRELGILDDERVRPHAEAPARTRAATSA